MLCNFNEKYLLFALFFIQIIEIIYFFNSVEEIEKTNGRPLEISEQTINSSINSLTISFPDPNNPAEYCSTIPPFEQVPEAQDRPPLTVMVPVGVLKRPGSNSYRRGGSSDTFSGERPQETVKQVIFSDGVRPGGDLVESSTSNKLPVEKQIGRTQLQLKSPPIEKASFSLIDQSLKRLKSSRLIIQDKIGVNLPPILNYNELKTIDPNLPSKPTYAQLLDCLRNKHIPCITFGLTKNLFVNAKLISSMFQVV